MAGEVKKISGRLRSAGGRSLADQLGLITWNHINETDEIERVLPVNDQKGGGLLVQVKILAQQAPEGEGPGARSLLRIVPVITKGLDVARDVSFNDENPFERRARSHSAVMIDGKDALAQIEGPWRVQARAEVVARDGQRPGKAFKARPVFLSARGETKRAV